MTETRTGKKTTAVMAKHMYIFILKSIIIASSVFSYTIEQEDFFPYSSRSPHAALAADFLMWACA